MSNSLVALQEQFQGKLSQFKADGSLLAIQVLFEPWATIATARIVALLQSMKGGAFSSRAIAVMVNCSLGTTIRSLNILKENGYIVVNGGRYTINTGTIISDPLLDQADPAVDQEVIQPWIKTDPTVDHDIIYLKNRSVRNITDPAVDQSSGNEIKKTPFSKNSIQESDYNRILKAPELGNNDLAWLRSEYKKFSLHQKSTNGLSLDWASAFELWTLRSREMQGKGNAKGGERSGRLPDFKPSEVDKASREVAKAAFAAISMKLSKGAANA